MKLPLFFFFHASDLVNFWSPSAGGRLSHANISAGWSLRAGEAGSRIMGRYSSHHARPVRGAVGREYRAIDDHNACIIRSGTFVTRSAFTLWVDGREAGETFAMR